MPIRGGVIARLAAAAIETFYPPPIPHDGRPAESGEVNVILAPITGNFLNISAKNRLLLVQGGLAIRSSVMLSMGYTITRHFPVIAEKQALETQEQVIQARVSGI